MLSPTPPGSDWRKANPGQSLCALPWPERSSVLAVLPPLSESSLPLPESRVFPLCPPSLEASSGAPCWPDTACARRPSTGSLCPAPPTPNWTLPLPQCRAPVQTNRKASPPNKAPGRWRLGEGERGKTKPKKACSPPLLLKESATSTSP